MADLKALDQFLGKYVSITEPNGDGLAGWIERMDDIMFKGGRYGRQIVVDYGYGWFITQSMKVEEVEPPRLVKEAVADGERGFMLYGGQPIRTDYGHLVSVRESSSAGGPHVWLFTDSSNAQVQGNDPHLSLAQAIALRAALDQFIESVPQRWSNGAEMLAAAEEMAFGRRPKDGVPNES